MKGFGGLEVEGRGVVGRDIVGVVVGGEGRGEEGGMVGGRWVKVYSQIRDQILEIFHINYIILHDSTNVLSIFCIAFPSYEKLWVSKASCTPTPNAMPQKPSLMPNMPLSPRTP